MKSTLRSSFRHIVEGFFIGGANVIPGVSGGTMALIFGIYEQLIDASSHLVSAALALILFDMPGLRRHLGQIPWLLLGSLTIGVIAATLTGARLIPVLLERYPMQSRGFFFGLIVGSLAIPWLRTQTRGVREHMLAFGAFLVAFFLAGLAPRELADPSLLLVFGGAAVAVCTMVLPGVSGAYLLLVLGLYDPTLRAVDGRDLVYVLVFLSGSAIGLGAFSLFLNWLLKHYHDQTMAILVGLMAGSLRALWPWLSEEHSLQLPDAGDPVFYVLLLGLLGFALTAGLTWWEYRRMKRSAENGASEA